MEFINHRFTSIIMKTVEMEELKEVELSPKLSLAYNSYEDGNFNVLMKVEIDDEGLPFEVSAEMEAKFQLNEDEKKGKESHEDYLEKTVCITCASIMFPFIREVVFNASERSGYRGAKLPAINFAAQYEHQKKLGEVGTKETE